MKYNFGLIFVLLMLFEGGCTSNEYARGFGGTATINVPCGQKVVSASWKETDLWYLTRPLEQDEKPVELTYREDSTYGFMEGVVLLKESTCQKK